MTNDLYADAQIASSLTPPMRLLLDTYAALNPARTEGWAMVDAVGGAFLEAQAPASMGEGSLAAVLDQLDALDAEDSALRHQAEKAPARLAEVDALPDPARAHAVEAMGREGWRIAGPGIRVLGLIHEGEAKAELLRIEPGCGAPAHGHGGAEYTLVLAGAFHDGGTRYGRGEMCVAGADDIHRPVAEPGEICYALAVTDAPLAFRGVLGLMQKVMGRA